MHRSVSAAPIGSNQSQQPVTVGSIQPTVNSIECRVIATKTRPLCMRMCPPVTLRNWKFHKPLLAIGFDLGLVQIFNLSTGKLYRELSVHSYSVKGIEWIGLNAFISYAISESFQGNDSNWELSITELDTGRTVSLKHGRSSEHSVIQSVKASHMRQYFIIVYKNNPFEIWDLETLSLLKRMPKTFSGVVAAEWSPLYSTRVVNKGDTDDATKTTRAALRENFVVTNKSGELYHFSITGNVVKEISKLPPETTMMKAVTAITWKSDHVVLGSNDGTMNVWDLAQNESRPVSTMRDCIRRIRFAPGRGNMKILVLFEDGVDLWDVKRLRMMRSIVSTPGRIPTIEDTDWAASDRPVILTTDGTVIVTDLEFGHLSASRAADMGNTTTSTNTSRRRNSNSQTNPPTNEPCHLQ